MGSPSVSDIRLLVHGIFCVQRYRIELCRDENTACKALACVRGVCHIQHSRSGKLGSSSELWAKHT